MIRSAAHLVLKKARQKRRRRLKCGIIGFFLGLPLLALFVRRQKPEMNASNYLGIVRSKVLNVASKINRINLQGVFCQIIVNDYVCHMLS